MESGREPTGAAYLTIQELSVRSRFSVSQLRRLAKAGRLPYLQPGGPGGKLLFPLDALEQAAVAVGADVPHAPGTPRRLPGRRPKWMATPDPDTPIQENA
jgi:excisionase family DNA binding protein